MTWLPECSPAAVTEALRAVAPELAQLPVTLPGQAGPGEAAPDQAGSEDPLYQSSSAALGDEFVVKFAWSQAAARRVTHQISVLRALAGEPAVPFLPEVVVASTDPLLLVTRRVPGTSLFEVVDSIDRDHAGEQLARFLAALHSEEAGQRVTDAVGTVPAWYPLVTTNALRERFGAWVSPDQQRAVERWCDWADEILSVTGQMVLVHGDLHGDNQVWDGGELRAVLDFENVGMAEPEYELRAFPGPAMGPDGELLSATTRHYERLTGRDLSANRIMAWHVRQVLSDALWRSEAGLPLPDHRSPGAWVDDLAVRFGWFGIQVLCHRPWPSRARRNTSATIGFIAYTEGSPLVPAHQ